MGRHEPAEEEAEEAEVGRRREDKPAEHHGDSVAGELDQWLKNMKMYSSNRGLEFCKDIKVGVHQSDTLYGAPSYEPIPDIKFEKDYSYSGGRDKNRLFHGKGVVEFSDGGYMEGTWEHGNRQGQCRIEKNSNGVAFVDGNYQDNKMNGKVVVKFQDDTWLEGFFKDGILHGFCRYFDSKGRLTFVGMHRNGKPFGTCWKVIYYGVQKGMIDNSRLCNKGLTNRETIIRGGGVVVGRVDEEGRLSGNKIAYVYPDFKTALVGTFKEGELVSAQEAELTGSLMDYGCIQVPIFSEPKGGSFTREISTFDFVTSTPMLRDPYESRTVEVRPSRVPGAEDGLFSRCAVPPNTVLAFYNGIKLRGGEGDPNRLTWDEDSYKIFDPSRVPDGTVDIPKQFRSYANYCASLAHKTNHSFVPNSEFVVFDHPRYGVIPCIASIHSIAAGEEIFVRYGYDLDYCPEWYLQAWESGAYPVPDSMKKEYEYADEGATAAS